MGRLLVTHTIHSLQASRQDVLIFQEFNIGKKIKTIKKYHFSIVDTMMIINDFYHHYMMIKPRLIDHHTYTHKKILMPKKTIIIILMEWYEWKKNHVHFFIFILLLYNKIQFNSIWSDLIDPSIFFNNIF